MSARATGFTLPVFLAALLSATAGEASPHEAALKQMMRALDKLTTTLSGIKDAPTADASRSELRKDADDWTKVKAKAAALPPPNQAEKDRLAKEYRGKMDVALKRFFTEVGRVRSFPEGKEVLQELKAVVVP